MSSYREVRKRMAEQGGDDTNRLPCMWCKAPTLREVLAQYGARCRTCYEGYLRERQPSPDIGDKRTGGPKAWAHALRRREEAGEKLTQAQRDAWRGALQAPAVATTTEDER